ncbi:MAG TPA: DUF1552 domain-containing protein [Polyangiaceae bacterium]|nr:DUF1552 domain-containing protein [Polyangiaceae bacterium]
MNRFKLDRRSVLRGMLGGFSVALALPPLEAMFEGNNAFAQSNRIKRMGLWFWGNGVKLDRWVPAVTGPNWTSPALESMASSAIKPYVNIISGMEMKAGNDRGHHSGWCALLSGSAILPQPKGTANYKSTFREPSIDQQLLQEIKPQTPFPSLELGVSNKVPRGEGTGPNYLSHSGPDSPNPAQYDPTKAFERVFAGVMGGGASPPGPSIADASTALKQSVLDAAKADITRLKQRVGAHDAQRLELHFTNIRSIEQRLASPGVSPVASCQKPAAPRIISDSGGEDVKGRNEVMSDLLALTLACDLTRIFSVHFSGAFGHTIFAQADPGIRTGHHDMSHKEAGDQPLMHKSTVFTMQQLTYLLLKLKDTPDSDGRSILDNMVLLASSDVADGKAHSFTNYPIIVAGGGSGYLKNPGIHYKSPAENTSNVLLTVLRAAGSSKTSVGTLKGISNTPCTAIEAAG